MNILKLIWYAFLWLRQIVFVLYMAVITIILASVTILLYLCKAPIKVRLMTAWTWSKLAYLGMVVLLWLRIKVEGKENIPPTSCVFICKHQSSWETVIFHGLIPRACFVLKQELLKIPFFGQGLKAVDSIAIDRSQNLKSFKKILQNGKARLKDGLNIIIFPEGTRVPVGRYPKFHRTAMMLAKSTGADVLPVAHNSGKFWPNKAGLIKPGCVVIRFGEVVSSKDFDVDALNEHCYNWINDEVKKLGA